MNTRQTRIRDNLTRRERRPGSGTVVMDRQNYLDVCCRQLNNEQFCNKVTDDPTDDINKRVRFYLNRLTADDVMEKEIYNYLLP